MSVSRVLVPFVALMLVAGCGTPTGTTQPTTEPSPTLFAEQAVDLPADANPPADPCQFGAALFDVGPVALCQKAVALATARLGVLHWPITSTRFRTNLCPPNARCDLRFPELVEGWVIFTFTAGDPVMIHVGPPTNVGAPPNVLVVGDPEPLPDWLREEIAAGR